MRKIPTDLIRLALSSAAICGVVGTAEFRSLHHGGTFAIAKTRVAPPIPVKAISVGAPALCWTIEDPVGASATPAVVTQTSQDDHSAIAQTCSSVSPPLRRLSEPESRLALAP